jgi:L-lactate utilization protein LutB
MHPITLWLQKCQHCGQLFYTCRHCGRYRRYCSVCAEVVRVIQLRATRAKHQASEEGRQDHNERQLRYAPKKRGHAQEMTDHFSPNLARDTKCAARTMRDLG